jgi:hypothetical protein
VRSSTAGSRNPCSQTRTTAGGRETRLTVLLTEFSILPSLFALSFPHTSYSNPNLSRDHYLGVERLARSQGAGRAGDFPRLHPLHSESEKEQQLLGDKKQIISTHRLDFSRQIETVHANDADRYVLKVTI